MKHKICITIIFMLLSVISLVAQSKADPEKKIILDKGTYLGPDNEAYEYEKSMVLDSEEETRLIFKKGDKIFSLEEINSLGKNRKKEVLSAGLKKAIANLDSNDTINAIVVLRNQPAYKISRQISKKYEKELKTHEENLIALHKAVRPAGNLSPDREKEYMESIRQEKEIYSREQRKMIRNVQEVLDKRMGDKRREISQALKEAVRDEQQALQSFVETLGGKINGNACSVNALSVQLPVAALTKLEQNPLVGLIFYIPPGEGELDVSAPAVEAQYFWNDGVDGGIWDIGILDSGVQQDHPAFSGVNFISNIGTTDSATHGTHVAGIIVSNNSTYKGLAYGLDQFFIGSFSDSRVIPDADWMVSNYDPEVINLSEGYGRANDVDYSTFDAFFDALVDNHSVLLTKSAGNMGSSGATSITHPAPAYNILAVANMDDMGTISKFDDKIASSSSRGPTLNGRRKPDIAAPGTDIMSANKNWSGTNPDFIEKSGTSMAAPHVAAGALLLTDFRSSDSPIANKAILINTADPWDDNGTLADTSDDVRVSGSLWNATYGWGYMDLWEAWYNGTDVFTSSVSATTRYKFYKGQLYANEKSTLVWNRHVYYKGAAEPGTSDIENLTDLDLHAYNASTGIHLAGSATVRENVEQISPGTSQETVLKVKCFNIDPDVNYESFALATEENFSAVSAPSLTVTIAAPGSMVYNSTATVTATGTDSGQLNAFNATFRISLSGFSLILGANSQNAGTITGSGGQKQVSWIVRKTTTGTGTITVNLFSSSYGESFTAAASKTVN